MLQNKFLVPRKKLPKKAKISVIYDRHPEQDDGLI
jgi:hypothetical protein